MKFSKLAWCCTKQSPLYEATIYVYKQIWSAVVGSSLPCLQESFNTHDSYAIGFTALLTASIHDNGTELANDPLELGKIASPLSSHVSNI